VPDFQKRARLRGDLPALEAQINELAATGDNIWLEIHYEGEAVEGGLRDRLHALTADTPLEILRLKNERIRERVLTQNTDSETLDDLNPLDVFECCLAAHHIPADQRDATCSESLKALKGEQAGAAEDKAEEAKEAAEEAKDAAADAKEDAQ